MPAGNPDGGQWTSEDAGRYSGHPLPDDRETDAAQKPVEYAALEPQTRTDATDAPAGAQYASETEDDAGENRAGGLFEGTPAQLLRQEIAAREYRAALSQVLRYDPTWKPSPSLIDPNDIEGEIARFEAWTKEAKEYFGRLRDFAKPLDRNSGNPIAPSTQKTGDPLVDSTTEKLNSILDRVVARIGPRSDRAAGQYGKEVHDEFKREVSASRLPGIDDEDLDRTFGVGDGASYGEKDSVRPDVVLRDDQGNIVAIYDVKTGAGFTSFQVIKYRLRTDTDSFVPIFELHPRRTIWRCQIH